MYWLGRGLGWGWSGLWSILAGMMLGQSAGILLVNVALGRQQSDGGFILGGLAGGGLMAAVWLSVGESLAAVIGDASRGVLGAVTGWLVVMVVAFDYRPERSPPA
jgi:hypothetical protein